MVISYALEPSLSIDDFLAVLHSSTLAERRPVEDAVRLQKMLDGADVILTARDESGKIIGLARAVTDFSYCCYLSDLAVDHTHQGQGIGTHLMKRVREHVGQEVTFLLMSAPEAMSYYPKVGLKKFENCFGLKGPWPPAHPRDEH